MKGLLCTLCWEISPVFHWRHFLSRQKGSLWCVFSNPRNTPCQWVLNVSAEVSKHSGSSDPGVKTQIQPGWKTIGQDWFFSLCLFISFLCSPIWAIQLCFAWKKFSNFWKIMPLGFRRCASLADLRPVLWWCSTEVKSLLHLHNSFATFTLRSLFLNIPVTCISHV